MHLLQKELEGILVSISTDDFLGVIETNEELIA